MVKIDLSYWQTLLVFLICFTPLSGVASVRSFRFVDENGKLLVRTDATRINDVFYFSPDLLKSALDPNFSQKYSHLTKKLTLHFLKKKIDLKIGETRISIDGDLFDLPNPPLEIDRQPAIPISFFTHFIPQNYAIETDLNISLARLKFLRKTITHVTPKIDSTDLPLIVIDAGHGGSDPGAISQNGIKEKEVVLKFAKLIKTSTNNKNFRVELTRSNDVSRRRSFPNATLLISLHCNMSYSGRHRGTEIYVNDPHASIFGHRQIQQKQRSKKNDLQFVPLTQFRFIDQSRKFAQLFQSTFYDHFGEPAEIRELPISSLKNVKSPAVLIELGYLSNSRDLDRLTNENSLSEFAEAISLSIEKFVEVSDQ